jgi:hypothetical protein
VGVGVCGGQEKVEHEIKGSTVFWTKKVICKTHELGTYRIMVDALVVEGGRVERVES